jgi:hypothetical protein
MENNRTVVKGGFRSTLSLIISLIALILALMAYNQSGGDADLKRQLSDLQDRIATLKKETSETVDKVKKETAKALEKVGIEIKRAEDSKDQK